MGDKQLEPPGHRRSDHQKTFTAAPQITTQRRFLFEDHSKSWLPHHAKAAFRSYLSECPHMDAAVSAALRASHFHKVTPSQSGKSRLDQKILSYAPSRRQNPRPASPVEFIKIVKRVLEIKKKNYNTRREIWLVAGHSRHGDSSTTCG